MTATDSAPLLIRTERDVGPLRLTRRYASIDTRCARCGREETVEALAFADWWDRDAVEAQHAAIAGRQCPRCGEPRLLGVPIVQYRRADPVGLLVALPEASDARDDQAWIRALLHTADADSLPGAEAVVTIRASWWPQFATLPLGPVLVGLVAPPPIEDSDRWLTATRAALRMPDVVGALNRFVTADSFAVGRAVAADCSALIDPRWRLTVALLGERLLALQEDDNQRTVVRTRLGRLEELRILGPDLTPDRLKWSTALAARVDRLVAVRETDGAAWLAGLRELVADLSPDQGVLLPAALTSLVAAMHGDVGRGSGQLAELVARAREAITQTAASFGDEHELTLMAALNFATVLEDIHVGERAENIEAAITAFETLGPRVAVAGSRLVADLTLNLAAVYSHRTRGGRTANQEKALDLFNDAAHLARLVAPDDLRLDILCLADRAAVYRERLSGSLVDNAERAVNLYAEAWAREAERHVLTVPERVLLASNRANAAYQLHERDSRSVSSATIAELVASAMREVDRLHRHHHVAMITLLNAGGVLWDLYSEAVLSGAPEPVYWQEARRVLEEAAARLGEVYAPDHPDRLTALANLGALYGRPVDGRVADAARCEVLLTEVIERGSASLGHRATAATNLGQLKFGKGEWKAAAESYAVAREARRSLLAASDRPLTRLAEIVDAGDLATKQALALVKAGDLPAAIVVLEEARALLRRRESLSTPRPLPPRVALVHLATSSYGSLGIVQGANGEHHAFVLALTARDLRPRLAALLDGEADRREALADLTLLLRPLVDETVGCVEKIGGEAAIDELAVVACGPLAGAPLHALTDSIGRRWLERWRVRFLPSQTLADEMRALPAAHGTVVAVSDPSGDLAHAASEVAAMQALGLAPRVAPAGWSPAQWLLSECLGHASRILAATRTSIRVTHCARRSTSAMSN